MKDFNNAQLKGLADFGILIAGAWFSAGIISPFFTKPKTPEELFIFVLAGLLFSWMSLKWSLILLKEVR